MSSDSDDGFASLIFCDNANKTASPGSRIYLVCRTFNKSEQEACLNQAPPVPQEMLVMRSMSSVAAEANSVDRIAVFLLEQAWSLVLED